MDSFLEKNNIKTIKFLHNNSYSYNDCIICGTRGWLDSNAEEDIKILKRELLRLELSLKEGIEKYGNDKKIIVMMHYPPFLLSANEIDFIQLINNYNVEYCIYGHIHGKQDEEIQKTENFNTKFKLVSCDYLNFELFKIVI